MCRPGLAPDHDRVSRYEGVGGGERRWWRGRGCGAGWLRFRWLAAGRGWLGGRAVARVAGRAHCQRAKVTTAGTTAGDTWTANTPEANVAEHAVAGIVDKTKIASGSYTQVELRKLTATRWREYSQDSLDASILSLPARMKAMVDREGDYLMKGEDY